MHINCSIMEYVDIFCSGLTLAYFADLFPFVKVTPRRVRIRNEPPFSFHRLDHPFENLSRKIKY